MRRSRLRGCVSVDAWMCPVSTAIYPMTWQRTSPVSDIGLLRSFGLRMALRVAGHEFWRTGSDLWANDKGLSRTRASRSVEHDKSSPAASVSQVPRAKGHRGIDVEGMRGGFVDCEQPGRQPAVGQ